jgi:hypothetical protein
MLPAYTCISTTLLPSLNALRTAQCPPNAAYLLRVRVARLPRHVRHLSAPPAVILLPSPSLRLLPLGRQRLMRHDHLCASTYVRGNAASRLHVRTLRPRFISPLRRQQERPVPVLIRSMVHPCGACQLLYTADTTIPPMHPPRLHRVANFTLSYLRSSTLIHHPLPRRDAASMSSPDSVFFRLRMLALCS